MAINGDADDPYPMTVSVRVYDNAVVFRQYFPNGSPNTTMDDTEDTCTTFPKFLVEDLPSSENDDSPRRGYMAYKSDMMGESQDFGEWGSSVDTLPGGRSDTAPIIVFLEDLSVTSVMSPLTAAMVANHNFEDGALKMGVMGEAAHLPEGFSIEFVLVASSGINQAMEVCDSSSFFLFVCLFYSSSKCKQSILLQT